MTSIWKYLLYTLIALFISACGGDGGGIAAPVITSFNSSSKIINAGRSVNLTAVFANGTGSIDNGVGNVTSGIPVAVTPASTTTYTLTVTNTAGTSVTLSVTVTVTSFSTVKILWNSNPETAVNQSGGGYKVYYSSNSGFNISDNGVTEIDVPYSSGATTPTSILVQLLPGTYYIRIIAYSALNAPGTSGGSTSTPSLQTMLIVS